MARILLMGRRLARTHLCAAGSTVGEGAIALYAGDVSAESVVRGCSRASVEESATLCGVMKLDCASGMSEFAAGHVV